MICKKRQWFIWFSSKTSVYLERQLSTVTIGIWVYKYNLTAINFSVCCRQPSWCPRGFYSTSRLRWRWTRWWWCPRGWRGESDKDAEKEKLEYLSWDKARSSQENLGHSWIILIWHSHCQDDNLKHVKMAAEWVSFARDSVYVSSFQIPGKMRGGIFLEYLDYVGWTQCHPWKRIAS